MRLYIYYMVYLAVIYNTGCQNKTSTGNSNNTADIKQLDAVSNNFFKNSEDITDHDGNIYHTIIIGKQVWMAENLKVTHYNNGCEIPQIKEDKAWRELNIGAYCNYNNKKTNSAIYGNLYNWYAVNDDRKLAPKGWHVPTQEEWNILIDYLGGNTTAGSKVKATGTKYWEVPNTTSTNQSGFNAIPGGNRNNNGMFENLGFSASFWSSTTEPKVDFAKNYSLISGITAIKADVDDRKCGLNVRCLKD
ncbi:fibrobacter succinogenes major paralogous domain-containing protein [Mucilaginibacter terrae]|uniref:fibrobacter succinogenes major paralogous domain-containing protein n=1 Tax=Mucilaginibacter terrae TaxID=1955052 RepID=UPI0036320787